METVQVGARDVRVTRLCFGTLTMGPLQRSLPVERGAQLIAYAAERGVTFVDTAEYYRTYPYIREALRVHPNLAVCTRSYAYDREGAKRSVALAQEGIGREHIDLFLMHEQESVHTLRGHVEALAYYLELRDRGVIGAVGISTHHVAAVDAAASWPGVDVVFPIINHRGLGIADGTREDMERAVEKAHAAGRFVMAMKVLGGGHLIRERERAFAYARALKGVGAIAIGMQSEAEIDVNIALMEGRTPDPDALARINQTGRTLIVESWCKGCGACAMRCGLGAISVVRGKAAVDPLRCVRCGYCAGVCPVFCLKVI